MNVLKKIVFVSILAIGTLTGCSSVQSMDDFYKKYNDKATIVPVPNFALKWASKATGGSKIFEHLKSSKVFVMTNVGDIKQKKVMRDLQSSTKGDRFDKIVHWNNKNKNVQVYYLENRGYVERLVFGINGMESVLVVDARLSITQDLLENLLENINLEDIQFIRDLLK